MILHIRTNSHLGTGDVYIGVGRYDCTFSLYPKGEITPTILSRPRYLLFRKEII